MKTTNKIYRKYLTTVSVALVAVFTSCNKYVDLDAPPNYLKNNIVFDNDATATAAVLTLYNYSSGMQLVEQRISNYVGISSDELHNTQGFANYNEFENNVITTGNLENNNYWGYFYTVLLEANNAITGINNSFNLSPAIKTQLLGECEFFRAFINFYLVNSYAGVPLVSGDDIQANAYLPRSTVDQVYAQITADLLDAQNKLTNTYAASPRTRVNKLAVQALLARVYLYRKDYVNAEAMATSVIGSGVYSLPATNSAFITTSNEVILQFATAYGYSILAANYRSSTNSTTIAPPPFVLTSNLYNSFETGDNRKTNWIDITTFNGIQYYRVNKYKNFPITTSNGNEYNVVLRLAEQYLIRAEARAQLGKFVGAGSAGEDLNQVRTRAGLPGTNATNLTDIMPAILQERKVELFAEFGHRWFDLVRTGQANFVLSNFKPTTWKATSVLFPIPDPQRVLNTNLTQNPGYN